MLVAGAIPMVVGVVFAAVLVIAVPALLGYMAYDTIRSTRSTKAPASIAGVASESESLEAQGRRIQVERGVARAFVVLGGAFWAVATFAGLYVFRETGWEAAAIAAAIPLFAALVTLVIGWYWERFAALMLGAAAVGVVYYGVTVQFELGVWILMTLALIGPMFTAAGLFWSARGRYVALTHRLESLEPAMAVAENR